MNADAASSPAPHWQQTSLPGLNIAKDQARRGWDLAIAGFGFVASFKTRREADEQVEIVKGLVAAFRAAGEKKVTSAEWAIWSAIDDAERAREYLVQAIRRLQEETARDLDQLARGFRTWNACRGYADRGSDAAILNAEYEAAAKHMHREINREIKRDPQGDTAIAAALVVFFRAGAV